MKIYVRIKTNTLKIWEANAPVFEGGKMKQIQQHNIDKVIRLTYKYRETGDTYLLPAKIEAARGFLRNVFAQTEVGLKFQNL